MFYYQLKNLLLVNSNTLHQTSYTGAWKSYGIQQRWRLSFSQVTVFMLYSLPSKGEKEKAARNSLVEFE